MRPYVRDYLGDFLGGAIERKSERDIDRAFAALVEQASSKAGVRVTVNTIFGVAAAFACLRVLSEGVAQLPFKLYREDDNEEKSVARKHPLYRVIYRRPNDWQTSFEWRETMMLHARLAKGSFNFISRAGDGRVLELIPLIPDQVKPQRDDRTGIVTFELQIPGGGQRIVPRDAMMVFRGPSWDGVTGMEVFRVCREIFGLAQAEDEAVARFHANGARAGGILSTDETLDEEALARIKRNIQLNNEGPQNAGKFLILDLGFKYFQTAMTGTDAQTLESRRMQVEEIARIMGVYPQMIGHSDKTSTYASAEQFSRDHVTYTLNPWCIRLEQVIARDLLTEEENEQGYFAKLLTDGLLRGDAKARAEYYTSGIVNGWLTRNEARRREDLNQLPGLDQPLVPANMLLADQVGALKKLAAPMTAADQKKAAALIALDILGRPASAALEEKIGRVLAARNEGRLKQARGLIDEVLVELEAEDGEEARAA